MRLHSIPALCAVLLVVSGVHGDGKLVPRRGYKNSLEERAQEAIIIFDRAYQEGGATEEIILKIKVAGQTDAFAWVIPFPKEPKVEKEDAKLFEELFNYVEHRPTGDPSLPTPKPKAKNDALDLIEVLSRAVVGSYDVAMVRENESGALNRWLEAEGYQTLPADAEDVLGFYRQKGYVFACIKVHDVASTVDGKATLHPLRFSFATGGQDGIYFPMKLTGLQGEPFDVNLYVFTRSWLNENLTKHGFAHRGFTLRYHDRDSAQCQPNAGKNYSDPKNDPYLRDSAELLPTVASYFQRLHPGDRYYLTNLQAHGLNPADVRRWPDDLWLFPYYSQLGMVPLDARPGGVASAAWASDPDPEEEEELLGPDPYRWLRIGAAVLLGASVVLWFWWQRRTTDKVSQPTQPV